MKLSLVEIKNWKEFEDLIAAYFRATKKEKNIIDIKVEPSGTGSDGGRDILVTFDVNDSLVTFKRKWVIQCKFHNKDISKSHLSNVNIPSLVHEYGANGYLLVCKKGVTSKVSEMFENLSKNCSFKYHYEIWNGNNFINLILTNDSLIKMYFPKYHKFIKKQEKNKGL
jgi:hypothetical protein